MNLLRALKPRNLIVHLRDTVTFGPSILLRHVLPRDFSGVTLIRTRLGRISLRPTDSDLNMLRDVFVKKSYDLNKYTQLNRITNTYKSILKAGGVPVIIDAGTNIGAVSIQLSKIFPEAKIIAVEPDTQNADICRRNCKQCENVIVVEATIGSLSGGVKLKRPDRNKSSCSIQAERGEGADIPVVTVDELLAKAGIGGKLFIIKIDIEGFEKDLFCSETSWLSKVAVVIIELHDWMLPGQYSSLPFQKAILSYNSEVLIAGENLIFVR